MVLHCMRPKPSEFYALAIVLYGFARALYESKTFTIHAEFYALASRVWCCMSTKPSLYCHTEFYMHWLVLYGVAVQYGVALYASKTFRVLCTGYSPVWFC